MTPFQRHRDNYSLCLSWRRGSIRSGIQARLGPGTMVTQGSTSYLLGTDAVFLMILSASWEFGRAESDQRITSIGFMGATGRHDPLWAGTLR